MISFLLGISPWWFWGALALLAVGVAGLSILSGNRLSRGAWLAVGAAALAILLLIGVRSALGTAKAEGKAECEAAVALKAAAERERTQAAADAAATALARSTAAVAATGIKEITRVETIWRDRPAKPCFADDELRAVQEARTRVLSGAARAGDDPVPTGAPATARD